MVERAATGQVEFRLYAPHADRVELVGTFTEWDRAPQAMQRGDGGWWTFTAEIKPGDHEFFYLVDGHQRLADYAAHGVRLDRFGQWVSGLHIEKTPVHEPPLLNERIAA